MSPCAITAMQSEQALLDAINFDGNTHKKMSSAQVAQANSPATTLDKYSNNARICP